MTVKELIEELKEHDPNVNVLIDFGEDRLSHDVILDANILRSTKKEVILG